MVTLIIAKLKTSAQMIIITIILMILGLKGLSLAWALPFLEIIKNYKLIYNLTLFVTLLQVLLELLTYFQIGKLSSILI